MTSIIKVNNIQNSSGTAAVTIDGSSNVTIPQNMSVSGSVTGTDFQKVTSVTSVTTDLTALTINLPLTTDFQYLKLILRLRGETSAEQYWQMQVRDNATGSYKTGSVDYKYMSVGGYLNTTGGASGTHAHGDTNGISYIRYAGGFAGDGSHEEELCYLEIDIYNTVGTDRGARFYARRQAEKRATDEWTYSDITTGIVETNIQVDQIKFYLSGGAEFSNYGYSLYKVLK